MLSSKPVEYATARSASRRLYLYVLVAIALGVVFGLVDPGGATAMQPLGEGFIKLVKMTIAPLIFCTIVTGIAGMKSVGAVGKAGGLGLLYFEIMTTIALVIGLVVINVIGPGRGMNINPASLDTSMLTKYTGASKSLSTVDFLLHIIPDTFFSAFAQGDLLPVLMLALLFGVALHSLGEHGRPVLDLIERLGQVVFKIVSLIMKAAPIGAFGAMSYTIGKFGVGTLASLGALMACVYGTCLIFIFVVLGAVTRVHGFSIVRFLRFIREELLIVLGTSSSESALPRMINKLQRAGVSKPVAGLVIPAGYSFNLDGTSIYLTMAAVFCAQATNTPLSFSQQLGLLAVLLLTSKGAAGVTGSGFIVLAATLGVVGHIPVASIAILLGIDRFMSEARALTNVIGNGVAAVVVARWCNELDTEQLQRALDGNLGPEAEQTLASATVVQPSTSALAARGTAPIVSTPASRVDPLDPSAAPCSSLGALTLDTASLADDQEPRVGRL